MTIHSNFYRGTTLLLIIFCILSICGCASSMSKEQSSAADEEVYIDLKQGFSVVVPSAWKRERLPVSSPRHQPNIVEWRTSSKDGSNTFKVKTISLKAPVSREEYLSTREEERFKLVEDTPQSILHPAGPAARWECEDEIGNIILLTIEGPEYIYILTGKVAAENSAQILPTVEKVISSFSIL